MKRVGSYYFHNNSLLKENFGLWIRVTPHTGVILNCVGCIISQIYVQNVHSDNKCCAHKNPIRNNIVLMFTYLYHKL